MQVTKFICAPQQKLMSASFMDDKDVELLNAIKATRYVDMLNALMSEVIADMYKNDNPNDTLLSLKRGDTLNVVYSRLQSKLVNSKFIVGATASAKADLAIILNKWESFIKYYSKFNPYIKTGDDFEYTYTDSDEETPDASTFRSDDLPEDEEKKENFDKPGNSYEEYELASGELQLLFRYLPKTKYNVEDGTFSYDLGEDGLPQQADYLNIMKLIIDKTKGIRDQDKFFNTVNSKSLYNVIPELGVLDRVLKFSNPDGLNSKQTRLLNSFYILFSRPYNPVYSSQKTILDGENIHKVFKNTKGNKDKIEAAFKIGFQSKSPDNKYVVVDNSVEEDGGRSISSDYGYNRKRLIAVPDAFPPIVKNPKEIDRISLDQIKKEYAKHLDFIKMLGVEFSGLDLVDNRAEKTALINVLNKAAIMRDKLSDRLLAKQFVFNPIQDIKNPYSYFEGAQVKSLPLYSFFTDAAIDFESEFSKLAPTIMSNNAEGEKQSDITLANAITIVFDAINNSTSEQEFLNNSYFQNIDTRNPQYKNSFIRKNVLSYTDGSMKIRSGNYNGYELSSEDKNFKQSTKHLIKKQKFINDFANILLHGMINTPQLERKSSYYFFQFLKGDKGSAPFDIRTFANNFLNNSDFFQQMLHYIQGEVERVKTYPDGLNEFNQFKFMEDKLSPLKNMSRDELRDLEDYKTPLSQSLKPALEAYFNSRLQANRDYIALANIDVDELIPTSLIEGYRTNPENANADDRTVKENALDGLLRAYIANSYIINTEFTIFVSGNPVFVKDFHKRVGSTGSTGILPTTQEFMNDYFKYNSEEKLFWNNYSLKSVVDGIEGTNEPRRDNSVNFLTSVIKEDVSKSNRYTEPQTITNYIKSVKLNQGIDISEQEAKDQLLVGNIQQGGIKVGDGQGYLNLDFHRELAIRQDFWRPNHDVSYQLEALVFKKNILKQPLSQQENNTLITNLNKILREPEKYALPTLKQAYYGPVANEDVTVDGKANDKFALFPLLPTVALGNPELENLLKTMASRQIGYVKYQSATKGYVRQVLPMNGLDGKKDLDLYRTDLLKLQLTPFEQEKEEVSLLTQENKLLFANVFNSGKASASVKKLRNEFINILSDLQDINRKDLLNGLGLNDKGEWNLQKLVSKISEQVKAQKLPSSLMDGLKINPDTGEFQYPLESSGIYRQVMDNIMGTIDRQARRFKVNGGDFILVSPSMFKNKPQHYTYTDDGTIATECFITLTKEYAKMLTLPDNKPDYPKIKNAEGKYEEYDIYNTSPIGTIERLNQLINNEEFYKEHKKSLTISLSRAPIDAPHSMGFGRITKFFYPTAGNIMVLPEEYLHQAGIDFDIDKERVLTPNLAKDGYYIEKGGAKAKLKKLEEEYQGLRDVWDMVDDYTRESQSWDEGDGYAGYQRLKGDTQDLQDHLLSTDAFTKIITKVFGTDILSVEGKLQDIEDKARQYIGLKNQEKASLFNRLLNNINNILALPELYSELILPSNTERVRALADKNVEDLKNDPKFVSASLPTGDRVYDSLENLDVFKTFNDAGRLIGPYALDNTVSEVMAQHEIKIPQKYFYKSGVPTRSINLPFLTDEQKSQIIRGGMITLTDRTNINGDIKQHFRSESISATVDATKDPFYANLNISFDNINSQLFLLTIGVPDDIINDYLSTSPIRRMIELKQEGLSLVEAFNKIVRDYGVMTPQTKIEILRLDAGFLNHIMKPFITEESNIAKNLKSFKVMDVTTPETKEERSDIIRIMANFIATEDHGTSLTSFKNLFKNDTNKTSSLFEVLSREEKRQSVLTRGMFTKENIEAIENDSTITPYRNDGLIKSIIEPLSPIISKPDVLSTLADIFNKRKAGNLINSAILGNVLTADFLTFNTFMFSTYTDKDGVEHKLYDYARSLIIKQKLDNGKFTKVLLDRLISLKAFPSYSKILAQFPVLDNIQGVISQKRVSRNLLYDNNYGYNIQLNVSPNVSMLQRESYQLQFKSMVNGEFDFGDEKINQALQNFVKDFFIAGLLQSGFNKSTRSYMDYAPISFVQSFLQPALAVFEHLSPSNRIGALSMFYTQFINNNYNYFPRGVYDDATRQDNTYLGKYYGNDNTLEQVKLMGKGLPIVSSPSNVVSNSEQGIQRNLFSNIETREYTPENITSLKPNEIFVFGSNTEGRHGKGAALIAKTKFGAIQGQAEGIQGHSYGIITKDISGKNTVDIYTVRNQLAKFINYARVHPENKFLVTKIGSNLAGFTINQMKEAFQWLEDSNTHKIPNNVILPEEYEVRKSPNETPTSFTITSNFNLDSLSGTHTINANQVQYSLKAVDILNSKKAEEIFAKGEKNKWSLDKILTELQIPKQEKDILLSIDKNNLEKPNIWVGEDEQKRVDLFKTQDQISDRKYLADRMLQDYTYAVEVNTSKDQLSYKLVKESEFDPWEDALVDTYKVYTDEFSTGEPRFVTHDKAEAERWTKQNGRNTQYYSNMTVPGGTNYTENEIAIPDIIPSIKGHAEFSTDNGIGWFRSDDQQNSIPEDFDLDKVLLGNNDIRINEQTRVKDLQLTKIRRILEVQSDLFQKGRDKQDLITKDHGLDPQLYRENFDTVEEMKEYEKNAMMNENKSSQNQFLQLLNKDNNWVTFFIKSIIQDSAKKGYEKVLFPSGDTAAKVEGHDTVEQFIKNKEARLDSIKENLVSNDEVKEDHDESSYYYYIETIPRITDLKGTFETRSAAELRIIEYNIPFLNEINQLQQEIQQAKAGTLKISAIAKFYEDTIYNILKKNGFAPNLFTDEYGNTWNEIILPGSVGNHSANTVTISPQGRPDVTVESSNRC